jgi:GNAT superfamily N-acetyltransferase
MLAPLSPNAQQQLLQAMQRIEELLSRGPAHHDAFVLRPHQPVDFGWIRSRHGTLYRNEQRYDQRFEAVVAQIVADFVKRLDAQRDCCWIAEKDGDRAGAVILMHRSARTAKLRALFVESFARGRRLPIPIIQECIRFARQVGYEKVILWTQRELKAKRGIYRQEHFKLVKEEPCQEWGRNDLVAETWKLRLLPRRGLQLTME